MHFPPLLAPGSHVALVSPAGPFRDDVELDRAQANVRRFGWGPVVRTNARARDGHVPGLDEQRARAGTAALADPSIQAIWCVRGGYGAMPILDALDYDRMKRAPKTLIGCSDATAPHAA